MSRPNQPPSWNFVVRLRTAIAVLSLSIVLIFAASQCAQAQQYQVLHYFRDSADGEFPWGGLTMDTEGNLYGTTTYGGDFRYCTGFGCGTVYKLTPEGSGWAFSTIYQFHGFDGAEPVSNLVIGPDGAFYGTTPCGQELGNSGQGGCDIGTLYSLKPPAPGCQGPLCRWTQTVLYRFTSTEGGSPDAAPTFDQAGNIYGTTPGGGEYGEGTVYELSPSNGGWIRTTLHSFGGPADGTLPHSGVVFDRAGNLYGTAQGTYYHGGIVYQLQPSGTGWVETVLHVFNGDGWNPLGGLIIDSAGNLYGATLGYESNAVVYRLSPSNGDWNYAVLHQLPGSNEYGGPQGTLAMDAAGNLYGASQVSIFKLAPQPDGSWAYTDLYDFGVPAGGATDGGDAPVAGVVLDPQGNLYGTASIGGLNNYGTAWEITP